MKALVCQGQVNVRDAPVSRPLSRGLLEVLEHRVIGEDPGRLTLEVAQVPAAGRG